MCAVRSTAVVELLPGGQFCEKAHIILERQQLAELFLIGSMGAFDFSIQLWRARSDVDRAYSTVFDMPMELRLPLVAAIDSCRMDPEREPRPDVLEKCDGVLLCGGRIDHQRVNPCRVIDSCVLIAPHSHAVGGLDRCDLDVHLHLVSWYSLSVTMRVERPAVRPVGQLADAIAHQDAIYA